jgi:hypothetical protein
MSTRVLGPTGGRRRRWTAVLTALASMGLLLTFFAVSASAQRASTASIAATTCTAAAGVSVLSGANFEIDDNANLTTQGASPCEDWNAVIPSPALVKNDALSGTGDDSFTNGSDINDPQPNIDTGSIPPSKSDLKSFGVYTESVGTNSFLNLFWSRVQNPTGTTDMDFEFNQKLCKADGTDCADNTPNGGKTPIHVTPLRTNGDMLITYLLQSGGTHPLIEVRFWNGNATSGSWGAAATVTSAIASINTTDILQANSDIGAQSAFTFGEASIDVKALLGTSGCTSFGSAYLKSRASDTDNTAGKDFIAPEPVSVTNCGSVLVKKVDSTDSTKLVTGAVFTITKGKVVSGVENASDTFTDGTKAGYYCIDNIKLDTSGTHSVEETTAAPGYTLPTSNNPQTIAVTKTAGCAARLAQTGATLAADIDLTFSDPPAVGAIQITKTGKDVRCTAEDTPDANCAGSHSRLLLGAVFTISKTGFSVDSSATDANGVACVDNVPIGSYTVSEKTAPTGYKKAADQTGVSITKSSTCAGTPEQNLTFDDSPLTDITVSVSPQLAGTTGSKINCGSLVPDPADATNGANDFDDTSETYKNNVPGTVTCTIVIDP